MGKYDFMKTKNVVPIHKTYTWEYEVEYGGTVEKINIKVYPFTVEEKLTLQNMNNEASILYKSTNKDEKTKGEEMLIESSNLAAYYVLKKDDADVTEELVAKLPSNVKTDLFYKALEFEGVDRETIEAKAKKAINEL